MFISSFIYYNKILITFMNTTKLLGFDFNDEQLCAINLLSKFIENNYLCPKLIVARNNIQHLDSDQRSILSNYPRFLLSGSAGTGKTSIVTYIILSSWCNHLPLTASPKYIVCAPTNKAKDVLMTKYIELRDTLLKNMDSNTMQLHNINELKQKVTSLIEFKTLSQVLGINVTINQSGDHEFTKGNVKKIQGKYNKSEYSKTIIFIDECSMIDINSIKKCQLITRPIVYLGDPCQLPPVNEDFSEVFHLPDIDNDLLFFNLTQVMRSKTTITECCNYMRNTILNSDNDAINTKNNNVNLNYIYNTYSKPKNKFIKFYNKKPQAWLKRYIERCLLNPIPNDMGICWTNSRCSSLNNKVRELLFKSQNNNIMTNNIAADNIVADNIVADNNKTLELVVDNNNNNNNNMLEIPYIMLNEKIIVKNTYYNYDSKCYTSLILRINSFTNTEYKAPSLLEWVKMGIYNYNSKFIDEYNELDNDLKLLCKNIDIDIEAKKAVERSRGTLFQYGFNNKKRSSSDTIDNDNLSIDLETENKKRRDEFCNIIRTKFYSKHNYYNNTKECYNKNTQTQPKDLLIVEDMLAKQDPFIKGISIYSVLSDNSNNNGNNNGNNSNNNVNNGNNTGSNNDDESKEPETYTTIHKNITALGFGIPVEKMHCVLCEFFSTYIFDMIKKKDHIAIQFHKLTNNIKLGCHLCKGNDNLGNKYEFVILDELSKERYEKLKVQARMLLASCYNLSLQLDKQEISRLKKLLDSDQLDALKYALLSNTNSTSINNIKHIPYSLIFGHFWNHVYVETLLEWDYGYFITTHKSQGSDYNEVYVDGGNLLKNTKSTEKNKLMYTALSRAKSRLNVYV